jgi:hypothetical protein
MIVHAVDNLRLFGTAWVDFQPGLIIGRRRLWW